MNAHQELLRAVYDHFQATGEWPALAPLQTKLRRLGHLPKLASEIGPEKIICDRSTDEGICKLTFEGIVELDDSGDIERFLFVIRALAADYLANGKRDIDFVELVAPLHLSQLEARRLGELLYLAPGLWSSFGRENQSRAVTTITSTHEIWYLEEVNSIEEYFAALKRQREDERASHGFPPAEFTPSAMALRRRRLLSREESTAVVPFIDEGRLEDLRSVSQSNFDLRRLIAMCEELNICAKADCFHATAMLTRAIIDHVPPIFNARNFDEVANNYPGSKSFKASMQHLSNSARNIADAHLHVQIRSRETLPTATQVDFSRDLDVLLAEIVRNLT